MTRYLKSVPLARVNALKDMAASVGVQKIDDTRRRELLRAIGVQKTAPPTPPSIQTQPEIEPPLVDNAAEFDSLPEGAEFIDARDGEMKVKG